MIETNLFDYALTNSRGLENPFPASTVIWTVRSKLLLLGLNITVLNYSNPCLVFRAKPRTTLSGAANPNDQRLLDHPRTGKNGQN